MPGFKSYVYLEPEAANYSADHARRLAALAEPLPPSLDARLRWPHCYSLHQIYNQGGCGSCYVPNSFVLLLLLAVVLDGAGDGGGVRDLGPDLHPLVGGRATGHKRGGDRDVLRGVRVL